MSDTPPELYGLACEIADCVTAIVPRGWRTAELTLDRRGDQLRVDRIDAKLDAARAGKKPELGMDEPGRIGGISAALTDLLHYLHSRRVNWDGLRATVSRPSAQQLVLTLPNQDGKPAWSVSLPQPFLDALFLSDRFLQELADAEETLEAKQAALGERIFGCTKWHYSQPDQQITFEFDDRPALKLPAQILGTWSSDDESWLWGWANTSVDTRCTERVEKALDPDAHAPGLAVFWREKFPCEPEFAAKVALLAGHKVGATAVYRGKIGPAWAYLAIMA